jgi:DNA-binding transcriptional LysR family regulator
MIRSEWSDFRYFLAVSRGGSLSAAARELHVNQSTVGRRLLALEASFGVRLFDRTPDGYALTAAGETIRSEVERLEDGFLGVERKLSGGDARISGVVRLATSDTIASVFVMPHLAKLKAIYPELSLELSTGSAAVDLARREADLAVRIGPQPKHPNLIACEIGAMYSSLYAAPRYLADRRGLPLRPGLKGHAVIGFAGPLVRAEVARWLGAHASEAEVAFRASSVRAIHDAVAEGLGIGLVPCALAERKLTRIRVGSPMVSRIWTVVHEDLHRSARIRAVLEFVRDVIRRSEWTKPPRARPIRKRPSSAANT